jgi:hypothetical protein
MHHFAVQYPIEFTRWVALSGNVSHRRMGKGQDPCGITVIHAGNNTSMISKIFETGAKRRRYSFVGSPPNVTPRHGIPQ